jgi:hypothetical protein
MAHFAQLNQISVVTQVIVVHNNELVVSKQATVNEDGSVSVSVIESEDKGIEFCRSLFGADTNWVQTSYNASFRGKYAAIGDVFDAENNIFVGPVPESIEIAEPIIEPVVMGESTHVIQTLTSSNVSPLSSAHIAALNTSDLQSLDTSDLQSLTTTGL